MQRLMLAAVIAAMPVGAAFAQDRAAGETPDSPAPEVALSKQSIDGATFADWEQRARQTADASSPDDEPARPADVAKDGVPSPSGDEAATADVKEAPHPFLVRMQVLLDRAHVSPGVIDGLDGGNTAKAVRAYEEMRDLEVDGVPDQAMWDALAADEGPAIKEYEISQDDLAARYVPELPEDYGELAKLEWAGYRDTAEMLAERFHTDEDLLRALNPDADFGKLGQKLVVPDTGKEPEGKVERIAIDKERGELFAYDADDKLVLAFPATIGSSRTPSPEGKMKVNGSAREPTYEYDPDKNFQQGDNAKPLTIPPGPNGPVGDVWIDLSKPTYGIHGTPEPSEIDKTASHGCVRLTNWDAKALAKLVQPQRTVVEFR